MKPKRSVEYEMLKAGMANRRKRPGESMAKETK
jgi:hypothetical protein